jgi:predicted TIM-barrel fold metal-dependent hydrolase
METHHGLTKKQIIALIKGVSFAIIPRAQSIETQLRYIVEQNNPSQYDFKLCIEKLDDMIEWCQEMKNRLNEIRE